MKLPTSVFTIAVSLTLGACATTGQPVVANGTPAPGRSVVAYESSGGAHRDVAAPTVEVEREPIGMAHSERGIPTPQPARDPGAMIPVPQPPIPAPDHHFSFNAYSGY